MVGNPGTSAEEHVLCGLNFDPEMVDRARQADQMLVLDMDLTRRCNLRCFYCDRTPDRLGAGPPRRELTGGQRCDLIQQARALGAWAVGLVGAGEPLLDPDFWPIMELINGLGMTALVYTSGWEVRDPATVDRLWRLNASIMLKYNTHDEATADKMAGVQGYGRHSKQVLDWLMERGFNGMTPTRLGINVVVTNVLREERAFLDLLRWCRRTNVYMHGQSLIPAGRADSEEMTMRRDEVMRLLDRAAQIDAEEFGMHYEVKTPFVGGFRCRKVNVGLFVNAFGEVWDCNGSGRRISDFSRASLADIWRSEDARGIRRPLQDGFCLIRERWWQHKDREQGATGGRR